MKLHHHLKSAAFLLALLGASSAHAGIINEWTVEVDAAFIPGSIVSTNGDDSGITVSSGDQLLLWGDDNKNSGLKINDAPITTEVDTGVGVALPPVENFSFTHANRDITGARLDTVTMSVSLTLTPLDPLLATVTTDTFDIVIDFLETKNSNDPCDDGGDNGAGVNSNGCGDILVISEDSLNYSFFADSDGAGGDDPQEYFVSLVEMTNGLTSLSDEACLSATGIDAPCVGFITPEREKSTLQFGAIITTEEVVIDPNPMPAPGILSLMGLALISLGGLHRRRKT